MLVTFGQGLTATSIYVGIMPHFVFIVLLPTQFYLARNEWVQFNCTDLSGQISTEPPLLFESNATHPN